MKSNLPQPLIEPTCKVNKLLTKKGFKNKKKYCTKAHNLKHIIYQAIHGLHVLVA